MTDKERILLALVRSLARPVFRADEIAYQEKHDLPRVTTLRKPVIGDLVICQGSGRPYPHPWVVGWVESEYDPQTAACTIRELDSDRVCRVSNESFAIVEGMPPELLLTGAQHGFVVKVHKAFARGSEWAYRYDGVDFRDDTVKIWVREAFGGLGDGESIPFVVEMPWTKRTTIKAILATMREAGYGTRLFERATA